MSSWLLFPKLVWNELLDIIEPSRLFEVRMFLLYPENFVGYPSDSEKKVIMGIPHRDARSSKPVR